MFFKLQYDKKKKNGIGQKFNIFFSHKNDIVKAKQILVRLIG